jgi:ribosomal protein S3
MSRIVRNSEKRGGLAPEASKMKSLQRSGGAGGVMWVSGKVSSGAVARTEESVNLRIFTKTENPEFCGAQ